MAKRRPPTIREARKGAGLTQVQLVTLSGVSLRTIKACEAEGRWPRFLAQRRAVAVALGVDPVALETSHAT